MPCGIALQSFITEKELSFLASALFQTMRMCRHPRFTVSMLVPPLVKLGRLLDGTAFPKNNGPICTRHTHLDSEQHEGRRFPASVEATLLLATLTSGIRLNRKSLGNGQAFDPCDLGEVLWVYRTTR